ncbi:hypothetical protein [Mycolicibacter acidiphilus]|uniref:hypothetical protein n=1 Tax=Mycolicibacter acidiphilus TaxID=2835306 RepID=UPI001BD57ACB|nr:hypothetical protein [Mycolicibacter acidiphilus]
MIAGWAVGALIAAGALLLGLVFVFGYFFMPGMDDLGAHPMTPKTAAWAMHDRKVVIPAGFTFEEGTEFREFVGANGYVARYRVGGDFDAAVRAVASANPDFPAPRRTSCADEIVVTAYPGLPWFSCDDGTRVSVTTRTVSGVDVAVDHYHGTPPGAVTLLVADAGGGMELFVLAAGS